MAKLNVYVPDALEARMRAAGLSPSELLQEAIDRELRLSEKRRGMEAFLAEGDALYGPPTAEDEAWAREALKPYFERFGYPEGPPEAERAAS